MSCGRPRLEDAFDLPVSLVQILTGFCDDIFLFDLVHLIIAPLLREGESESVSIE